jgi:hypothetical protein
VRRLARPVAAAALGLAAGVLTLVAADALGLTPRHHAPRYHLVAEDASAPLSRIAIHYAPSADPVALPVWRQLFRVLPARVEVEVEIATAADFDRFEGELERAGIGDRGRFHPVVVGHEITTWSRDRFAALVGAGGEGAILAPPRVETAFGARAGDMESPHALSKAIYGTDATTARIVFQGGDLAASADTVFVGAELELRSRGRGDGDRAHLDAELRRHFDEDVVWLGDAPGDVPHHHVMMYMVPLDAHTALVGDPRAGARLAAGAGLDLDPDLDGLARQFDRVADLLTARGMKVIRVPCAVLDGAGAYVTYTNALFDREPGPAGRPIVYLPTYAVPALDDAATRLYQGLGYVVHPIDVSGIYRLNGSIGCLVNVLARAR